MMRKCLLTGILLLISFASAFSSTSDWRWYFGTTYLGTATGASDSLDSRDEMFSFWPGGHYTKVYEQTGVNGWTAPNGFYGFDYRAPLTIVPGTSKTWRIYVWGDTSSPENASMGIACNPDVGVREAWDSIEFRLTYVRSAVGVVDDRVGSYIIMPHDLEGGGGWALPTYRTDNPLNGYVFDFTATVVPEPSSLAALGLALSGLGLGLVRRRRR